MECFTLEDFTDLRVIFYDINCGDSAQKETLYNFFKDLETDEKRFNTLRKYFGECLAQAINCGGRWGFSHLRILEPFLDIAKDRPQDDLAKMLVLAVVEITQHYHELFGDFGSLDRTSDFFQERIDNLERIKKVFSC